MIDRPDSRSEYKFFAYGGMWIPTRWAHRCTIVYPPGIPVRSVSFRTVRLRFDFRFLLLVLIALTERCAESLHLHRPFPTLSSGCRATHKHCSPPYRQNCPILIPTFCTLGPRISPRLQGLYRLGCTYTYSHSRGALILHLLSGVADDPQSPSLSRFRCR